MKTCSVAVRNPKEPATMVDSQNENGNKPKNPNGIMMDDDERTVPTETLTTKMDYIKKEMKDNTLHFKIPYCKGQANKHDFKLHVKLLITMTKAFNSTELQINKNKNQLIKSFAEPK
jgi:hypothetical protein